MKHSFILNLNKFIAIKTNIMKNKLKSMHFTKAVLFIAVLSVATVTQSCKQNANPEESTEATTETLKTPVETSEKMNVLTDGSHTKLIKVENMNMTRYIELFLAIKDPKTGGLVAACYNPMFTSNGIPASKDTAPQNLVEGLDFDKIKQDYNLLGASLNGPKLWMPDWSEMDAGVVRDFNGIEAVWVAQLNMDGEGAVSESKPYKSTTIARKSQVGWNKGTTVLLLDDAEGNTWIMKGFQLGLNPQYTYEQFVDAGASNFKKLPEGWKFRIKVLDEDLIEKPENGVATIMPDEFFNVYDKTGPGMTNYKP
jgi:hypothetical protein